MFILFIVELIDLLPIIYILSFNLLLNPSLFKTMKIMIKD